MQTTAVPIGKDATAAADSAPRAVLFLLLLLATMCWRPPVVQAENGVALQSLPAALLLIEDHGCPYCARWDREVREAYQNSPEGRFAPLVRRFRGAADVSFVPNVIYSPTFVVLVEGKEAGRIIGYQSADFFWAELDAILARAGFKAAG